MRHPVVVPQVEPRSSAQSLVRDAFPFALLGLRFQRLDAPILDLPSGPELVELPLEVAPTARILFVFHVFLE